MCRIYIPPAAPVLPDRTFPTECPYRMAEILDNRFFPGEPSELAKELA